MKKKRKRITLRVKRTVNVLQKLNESGIQGFTITDLKHLNGSLLYHDFQPANPKAKALTTTEVIFDGKQVTLFEFPIGFEAKIESKISYHFHRKSINVKKHEEGDKETS